MYIRGPGIAEGSVQSNGFVVNIDLAPTFLAMAGMATDDIDALAMDGELRREGGGRARWTVGYGGREG